MSCIVQFDIPKICNPLLDTRSMGSKCLYHMCVPTQKQPFWNTFLAYKPSLSIYVLKYLKIALFRKNVLLFLLAVGTFLTICVFYQSNATESAPALVHYKQDQELNYKVYLSIYHKVLIFAVSINGLYQTTMSDYIMFKCRFTRHWAGGYSSSIKSKPCFPVVSK